MAIQSRPRSYKEILTPVLHRRFTRAAGVVLTVCYVEAVLLGEKSSLLWWFPIGLTGVRALLLLLSSLAVFVLRVAQRRFQPINTRSPFESFVKRFIRFEVLQTCAWYLLSAWLFGEIYIWSASEGANLGWIAHGKYWEKKRLNERPIYLRSVFVTMAFVQSGVHLYFDLDRVFRRMSPDTRRADLRLRPLRLSKTSLLAAAPARLRRMVTRSVIVAAVNPLLYILFLRNSAWNWMLWLARIFWELPAMVDRPFMLPYDFSLLARSLVSIFFLDLLWESSNVTFGAFLAQEPLNKGNTLTDASQDPDGTLLNGLRAKNGRVKTSAFWELVYISRQVEKRRKSIFADIDRSTGPMWKQILAASLQNIEAMNTRIDEFRNPSPSASDPRTTAPMQRLPRLSAPLKQDPILQAPSSPSNRLEKIESQVGTVVKSFGEAAPWPHPLRSLTSPRAKQYLRSARQKLLTPHQQEILTTSHLQAVRDESLDRFLHSSIGGLFRQTFPRRASAIIFGTPTSSCVHIVDSIDALAQLAHASLEEDPFGKVAEDVPHLIRTYMKTIDTVESFVLRDLQPHWTDIDAPAPGDRRRRYVPEVEAVLVALREGLKLLVDGFGEFRTAIGVTEGEIVRARALAFIDVGGDGDEADGGSLKEMEMEKGKRKKKGVVIR